MQDACEFESLLSDHLSDEIGESNRPLGTVLEERYQHERKEWIMSRLLDCCKGDAKLALKTLLKDCAWRETINIDKLCQQPPARILGCDPETIAKCFPVQRRGYDMEGREVLYYGAKFVNMAKVLEETSLKQYVLYQSWVRETCLRRFTRENPDVPPPYFQAVVDLSGVRLNQASRDFYSAIKCISDLDQWHFPGTVQRMYIVNAPFFFTVVWKVIRKFLSAEIEKRIEIIGSGKNEVYSALTQCIPHQNIPVNFFGGSGPLDWSYIQEEFVREFKLETATENQVLTASVDVEEESLASSIAPSSPLESPLERQTDSFVPVTLPCVDPTPGLDPSSCLPPHIAMLVYDKTDPPREGLRSDLLQAIHAVVAERDAFERYALYERRRLRGQLARLSQSHKVPNKTMASPLASPISARSRTSSVSSARSPSFSRARSPSFRIRHSDSFSSVRAPKNVEIVKSGLRVRIHALREQIANANEECNSNQRAVKFARNFIEQESLKRDKRRCDLESKIASLRRENIKLLDAIRSSLGEDVARSLALKEPISD